jgi:hypothetical protein
MPFSYGLFAVLGSLLVFSVRHQKSCITNLFPKTCNEIHHLHRIVISRREQTPGVL